MSYHKLGRTSSQRKATLRNITTGLIIDKRIVTIEARAKEVCPTVEKMITLDKRGDLHARRQAATFIRNRVAGVREEDEPIIAESALQELSNDLGPCFAERQGGYTRILKIESGHDDAAPVVVVEFVR